MIRNTSLLKDSENNDSGEVDELRAELIKQKVVFEAELRRQREISDDRFDALGKQLQLVLEDNSQLRQTLHALGDRLSVQERKIERQRSVSPVFAAQQFQQQQEGGGGVISAAPSTNVSQRAGSALKQNQHQQRATSASSRQASPIPRSHLLTQPQAAGLHHPQHHQGSFSQYQNHQQGSSNNSQAGVTKMRPSPSTTPKTTPRQPVTRTTSSVSQVSATSPAHVNFRPVLRSNNLTSERPFRSPMRQKEIMQIGKTKIGGGWK